MGYFSRHGLVGQYKGLDVFVIDYDNLTPEMETDFERLYAVKIKDGSTYERQMKLVQRGIIVGTVSDEGTVALYPTAERVKMPWPTPKKAPVIEEKKPEPHYEITTPSPTTLELDVSEGYGVYSNVVDGFFKGLDKLWEEIDKGLEVK